MVYGVEEDEFVKEVLEAVVEEGEDDVTRLSEGRDWGPEER